MQTLEKDVIEGNKLIEIFKGIRELMPDGQTFGIKRGSPKQYENWYDCISVHELKYHSSWDWLMPVVEKIEYLKDNEGCIAYSVNTGKDWCIIETNSFKPKVITAQSVPNDKRKSTWLAVIDFIKFYNKNK